MTEQIVFYITRFEVAPDGTSIQAIAEDHRGKEFVITAEDITKAFHNRAAKEGVSIQSLLDEANKWVDSLRKQ